MAITITFTIPGSLSNPESAISRLKDAIDYSHLESGDGPSTVAEYQDFIRQRVYRDLRRFVRQQEEAKRIAELPIINEIEIGDN